MVAKSSGGSAAPLVLVADDDATLRDLVCTVLADAGFRSVTAADGDEVVALALEHQPVLIVLDLMMPRMDGYTVLARLRGHRSTKTIPAIILTGQAEPVYRALSAGVGAVAHVTKPFSPREFTDTVRRLVADGSP